jgi:hypothetical protein
MDFEDLILNIERNRYKSAFRIAEELKKKTPITTLGLKFMTLSRD